MNSGYLSLVIQFIALILLACGWKDVIFKGVSHTVILLFLGVWTAASQFDVPVGGVRFNGVCLLLALCVFYVFFRTADSMEAVYMVSIGMFLGTVYFFLQQLYRMNHVMIVYKPMFDLSMLVAMFSVAWIRDPIRQFAVISFGLIAGELMFHYLHWGQFPNRYGGASFHDQWWLVIFTARFMSLIFEYMANALKSFRWKH